MRGIFLNLLFVVVPVALLFPGCSDKSVQTPAANVSLSVEPNVGVGPVHKGMTAAQVIAVLGEPPRRPGKALEYPALGLAVIPGSNDVVQIVMCGDVTGINGRYVEAFTGKTKEGIGMKSTREDLVKAFGEPRDTQTFPGGAESVPYPALGITFTLERGRVHHMVVHLESAPDRTVTIETAPK